MKKVLQKKRKRKQKNGEDVNPFLALFGYYNSKKEKKEETKKGEEKIQVSKKR
jgi:hypothetical protein